MVEFCRRTPPRHGTDHDLKPLPFAGARSLRQHRELILNYFRA
jgi:hypothetical protein